MWRVRAPADSSGGVPGLIEERPDGVDGDSLMNNLQYLYMVNADFQRFIANHLVVFEHWYKNELGEISIDSDIEAHDWLMAQRYDSSIIDESCREDYEKELAIARNDYDALKLYAGKVRDLLVQTFGIANYMWNRRSLNFIPVECWERLHEIHDAMAALGIEVK